LVGTIVGRFVGLRVDIEGTTLLGKEVGILVGNRVGKVVGFLVGRINPNTVGSGVVGIAVGSKVTNSECGITRAVAIKYQMEATMATIIANRNMICTMG
jgi:hypothetical protein